MRKRILFNILFIIGMTCLVSCNDDNEKALDEGKNTESGDVQEDSMDPITEFTAVATLKANELQLKWKNPSDAVLVEISYALEVGGGGTPLTTNVRVYGEKNSKYTLQLPEFGTYQIAAVAVDNYGKRSEKVTISATPAEKDAIDPDIIAEYKLPIADPFVLYHEGKYYAYGTRVNGFEVYISEEHICVATSTSPEGPFIQREKKPIVADEKGIDTSFFIDDDGTPYLYYVRFTGGNVIWVAEMNDDLTSIKKETLTKCISATEPWEKKQGTIAEGPSLLKKGNTYYLIYSANHYESKDYAVGYATASSPKGPWTKYSGNPILRRDKEAAKSVGLVGTGHGAPFVCANGSYKYIFHAHASETSVGPRTSYISNFNISDKGVISITGETIEPVRIK